MTKLATRIDEIQKIEKFRIVVKNLTGVRIPDDTAGYPPYKYDRKLKDASTVQDFKNTRLNEQFAGFGVICEVLNADGTEAVGQTKLKTVRES